MSWMAGDGFISPPNRLVAQEADIIEHMNADHAENLIAYCQHFHQVKTEHAEMLGIDTDGFDVRANETMLRFDFAEPITDAQEARSALVSMAKACRA